MVQILMPSVHEHAPDPDAAAVGPVSDDVMPSTDGRHQGVVCILGMHRSGTSLLTRVLNLTGVHLGPEGSLEPGNEGQPKGYWEHKGIVQLNDALLSRHGGRWDVPPVFPPGWETSPMVDDLKQRARLLIHETFADAPVWGWKDPRNCLTLPFWRQLLPDMRYVVCLRNPVDVAHSLADRNGFSPEKSSDLWLRYVTSALQRSDGQPRLIVFYEDLMANWQRELRRLAAFVGMPERAEQADVTDKVQEYIEAGLQHYRTSINDTVANQEIARRARALFMAYRISMSVGRGVETGIPDDMDRQIEDALNLLSRQSVAGQQRADRLSEHPGGSEGLLSESQHTIQILRKQLEARSDQLEILRTALQEAEVDRAARLEAIHTLTHALHESEADRAERFEQIQILTRALQESDVDRTARFDQIQILTRALQESEADRAARFNQIQILTRALRELEANRGARFSRLP